MKEKKMKRIKSRRNVKERRNGRNLMKSLRGWRIPKERKQEVTEGRE